MITVAPTAITVCDLEVIVMPNGEVLCLGKTIGWLKTLAPYLTARDATKPRVEAE